MNSRTRRHSWRMITATGLIGAIALTGCTAAENPENVTDDSLTVGILNDLDNQFPWKATDFVTVKFLGNIYDTLVQFDNDLNVVPGLAESHEVSEDGLTVTFNLREGVLFTDGSTLDSEDVKFSLDAIKDEATAAVARSSLVSVESVEAPDPLTVIVHLSNPDAALGANLAHINTAILSSEDTEAELAEQTNGSGPFLIEGRVPNESVTIVRNDDYWGDAPLLSTIEFLVIPDEPSIVSALQAGSIQFAELAEMVNADAAEAAGVSVEATSQLSYYAMQFNARMAPLDDVNLRLAIQCAVDRQQVIDAAALGAGEITGPITSPAFQSDPNARPCPERDLDKAREYLAASAYPDGVSFDLMAINEPVFVNAAQSIQAQVAEIGVEMNLDAVERGLYIDRWVAADFVANVARNGGSPDPDSMYGRYFRSTGNLNTVAGYSSDELDALFEQGKASSDPAERKETYSEISRELEDNAVWVWLYTGQVWTATAPNVVGYTPMANGSLQNLRVTSVE